MHTCVYSHSPPPPRFTPALLHDCTSCFNCALRHVHANRAAICCGLGMCLNLALNLGFRLIDRLCVGVAENVGGCAIFVNVALEQPCDICVLYCFIELFV